MLQKEAAEEGDADMKKNRLQTMDRISDLPDPIVHHIMSFLTTLDITKISILSKRFFFLWSSFPVIDFDQSTFARTSQGTLAFVTDAFLNHIHNSTRLRRIDTVLSKFRVKANLNGISVDRRFDSAISFALENGVKIMDLNLGFAKYQLPVSFASESINVLSLNGLKFDLCDLILACPSLGTLSLTSCEFLRDVNFSSLTLTDIKLRWCVVKFIKIKALNLHYFFFDADKHHPTRCQINLLQCENIRHLWLHNLVNGHDWIEEHANSLGELETFILNGCQDIKQIRVCNEKLERVNLFNCPALVSVEVIAPSLKYFCYRGTDRNRVCNISFTASSRIRYLSIEDAGITDQWMEAQLAKFRCLEGLRLVACNSLKKVKIVHENLQELELYNCLRLTEAEINTPQLLCFEYRGGIIELCTMELIIPEELRERLVPPLYDLQHLEIHIKSMDKIETDLVDSLLWLSPLPKTLRISSGLDDTLQMIIKFAYNEMIGEEEDKNPFCCRSKPIKCWRHNLTRVDIKSSDDVCPNNGVELQKYFRANTMMLDTICFSKGQFESREVI
ncbi:F-box domain, cyclin-like protein [Cynara cardunculus var. scolymus]|uniref:F-box domain, cyclin-like protein n=1 Tax=Cynara cardunculus var. scolymus TaxID=59895 RepID=A0A103XS58_CYNCS|nr:F-box domain, cyclin-like protein [Cynara cardunculus var. scolymus]